MNPYIEKIINNHNSAIHSYMLFGIGVFFLGVIILILGFILPPDITKDGIKTVFSIGGTFITSLTAYPIKEIINRREKKSILEITVKQIKNMDKADEKRLNEIVWKLIEKSTTG